MTNARTLWTFLTKTHTSITEIGSKRQSELLAGVLVVTFVGITLATILYILSAILGHRSPATSSLTAVPLPAIALAYAVNRRGDYRLAAMLLIGVQFLFVHVMPLITGDLEWLLYASPLILALSLFFEFKAAVRVAILSFALQFCFLIFNPQITRFSNLGVLIFFSISTPVILFFLVNRRAIERARQQELRESNERLRLSEASLEQRVKERTSELQQANIEINTAALERTRLLTQVQAAQAETTILYRVGERMNAAQNYVEIVAATASFLERDDDQIVLNIFEHFDMSKAAYFEVVAGRMIGGSEVAPMSLRFDTRFIAPWVGKEVFTVNDVARDPRLSLPFKEYCLQNGSAALLLAGVMLGDRVVGVLNISCPNLHIYEPREIAFIQAAADLTAAALERVRLYNEQVKTAEQLRELDTMKSQFLASMSHELRTPMNAILNFTEFVKTGMLGPVNQKQVDVLEKSFQSGRHLLALINDVLDIAKIESGMMTLFIEADVDVRKELDAVIAATEPSLQGKPVALVQDIAPALPVIVADRRRIRQVLLNLLSNAAKFTERGTITLSASTLGDDLLFTVRDTGPGIKPDEQAIIFEPFVQTEVGIKHAGGTGLGLPISKRLVEAHGGRLWLESAPSVGAAFHVTLPIRSADLLSRISSTPDLIPLPSIAKQPGAAP